MADLRELLKDNDGTFPYKPGQFRVTADIKRQFERDGYIIVRYFSLYCESLLFKESEMRSLRVVL